MVGSEVVEESHVVNCSTRNMVLERGSTSGWLPLRPVLGATFSISITGHRETRASCVGKSEGEGGGGWEEGGARGDSVRG